VAEVARLVQQGSIAESQARQSVRGDTSVVAQVRVSPLIGPRFALAVREAARAAGATAGAWQLQNPLEIDALTLELELSAEAISTLVGDTQQLADALRAALERQRETALATGSFQVALSAKDLWCDIAQGRASVVMHVTGRAGRSTFMAQTRITGVEPLGAAP
jgi:hypothetical protein